MTERAGGAATATKAAAKKASVQVTPEAYDRVIMVANHYGMTQRGAASLMLMGISPQGIQAAVTEVNSRLRVEGTPGQPDVPMSGDGGE